MPVALTPAMKAMSEWAEKESAHFGHLMDTDTRKANRYLPTRKALTDAAVERIAGEHGVDPARLRADLVEFLVEKHMHKVGPGSPINAMMKAAGGR